MLSALSTTPLETSHNFERRKYLHGSFQNGHIISGNVVLRLNYYKHIIKFSGPHNKNAVDARKLSAVRTTLDCNFTHYGVAVYEILVHKMLPIRKYKKLHARCQGLYL